MTPREVFEQLSERISAGRFGELAELYAEDAVVEIVFEPRFERRIEGRAALDARFEQMVAARPVDLVATNVVVRETDDPEVVVAEWDYQVHHLPTGRRFEVANIQVLRVRDGLIVSSRDFHDHVGFALGGDRLEEFVAGLTRR
ncbi:nuclear transport factor 2 family protein [Kitasatospora sp. NPDC006697]|uniref:nuclear transport factor 2 family protein n=1 Tax=Kitasatospora sp. NPDC006697 TaxID=3364020 RepID=UPI0036BBDD73